ncbi:MAG: aminopeptidase P family protein [Acidobacteriota bacterium]|jgi:Xaa-Pro aminopeptidase|nr:aminopeptidase P family protein [Acidobacteriota bacterium]
MKSASPAADWRTIFRDRRNAIRKAAGDGAVLWLGHALQPRNYAANAYPFRQNSHFLYYTGLAEPDLALLMFPEPDRDILFARPEDIDDIVWSGPRASIEEMAYGAGIEAVEDVAKLKGVVDVLRKKKRGVHHLPPYQHSTALRLARLLGVRCESTGRRASAALMEAVAGQRSVKSAEEVAEIENALAVTARMHRAAMAVARPGLRESDVAGAMQGIALAADRAQAFDPIVTVHGEVLHNHAYDHVLKSGRLLLNDSGAESPMGYASDVTRTFPVNGRFTKKQAEIYQVVLDAQAAAIGMIRPGVSFRDVHLGACRVLAEGLKAVGLMKGDPADAVESGAHALFMPHGIGHMMGLDVHDMEDLGDIVGYKKKERRSGQFGLNYLRLNRALEPGFVLTVEPGVYFIPALIGRWRGEGKFPEFIDYGRLEGWLDFGGVRIEDDVLVTPKGAKVLDPARCGAIPKSIKDVEAACAAKGLR